MPINYPRSTDSKYSVYEIATAQITKRNINYPRYDGSAPRGREAQGSILLEQVLIDNAIDADRRLFDVLVSDPVIDLDNGTITTTINPVLKPNTELIEKVLVQERFANEGVVDGRNPENVLMFSILFTRGNFPQISPSEQELIDQYSTMAQKINANSLNSQALIDAINNGDPFDIDSGWTVD